MQEGSGHPQTVPPSGSPLHFWFKIDAAAPLSAQVAVAESVAQHVLPARAGWLKGSSSGIFPARRRRSAARGVIEGQAVWAQFGAKGLDVLNQGSLFVTVSGPSAISSDGVREIFEAFGPVKEVRESPTRIQNKFVEFFDVRDAARAHNELSGRDVGAGGVRLTVTSSRTRGLRIKGITTAEQGGRATEAFPLARPRLATEQFLRQHSDAAREAAAQQCARISSVSKNSVNSSNKQGKKNKGDNSNNRPSSSTPSSKQGGGGGGSIRKNWKNYYGSKNSGTNAKSSSSDSCSQKLLLNMLDNHCIHCNEQIGEGGGDEPLSAYDFVYLPIDFNNKCNVGYGFVNLTSPEAAVRLYKAFHMQPWEVFNSRKICQVTYARLQGLEVLKEHFRNSKFACDNDEYLPVVFEPARDGAEAVGICWRKFPQRAMTVMTTIAKERMKRRCY
ncbi:uncharacterized protein A4U43_C04F5990 [Asparagus officinalis]|uniref:RRM domain-containing protein n=1 Tax=Asparagus officinalis TaxID=4686 RepID=A0A5P1F1B5_ASPOF|nr:uncharacterized protein A4U43_C04F5990 [Asparagus officinalis]